MRRHWKLIVLIVLLAAAALVALPNMTTASSAPAADLQMDAQADHGMAAIANQKGKACSNCRCRTAPGQCPN